MSTTFVAPTESPLIDLDWTRARLRDAGWDALIASSVNDVFHLSGHHGSDGGSFAVVPADPGTDAGVTFDISTRLQHDDFPSWPAIKVPFGEFYVIGAPLPAEASAADGVEGLKRILERQGLSRGRLALNFNELSHNVYERLRLALPDAELVDGSGLFVQLRAHKSAAEIARLRHAAVSIEQAIETSLSEVVAGETEYDVANRIKARLGGARVEPSSVFVGAGPRGATVITWPTERVIQRGDVIRVDVTAHHHRYHGDLSRNVAVGEATEEQRRLYRIARRAMEAALQAVAPGVSAREVWQAAHDSAHADGLDDFRRNMVGHGIGLNVHQHPVLADRDYTVEPDNVLSIEAPYYRYDLGGFSPEDAVLVTASGVERWTTAPDELPIVG